MFKLLYLLVRGGDTHESAKTTGVLARFLSTIIGWRRGGFLQPKENEKMDRKCCLIAILSDIKKRKILSKIPLLSNRANL